MGVLSDIIAYKEQQRQEDLADIQAIESSIGNFIALQRQSKLDELDRENILSQIENRESQIADRGGGNSIYEDLRIAEITSNIGFNSRNPLIQEQSVNLTNQILSRNRSALDEFIPGGQKKLQEEASQQPSQAKAIPGLTQEEQAEIAVAEAKDRRKAQSKIEAGQRSSLNNVDLVSGAFRELSQTYADAVEEGGVGSKFNEIKSDIGLFLGGGVGEKFDDTSAMIGQRTEVVARMMPLLTQQGDKPGSVRLVATVFDRLNLTLPQSNTPPKNARKMMEKTLRNMYRFSRAAARLKLTNEDVDNLPQSELSVLSGKIETLANTIELDDEENAALDKLLGGALRPVDNLINNRSGKLPSFSTIDEGEKKVEVGEQFIVNGVRYEKTGD